MRNFIEIPQGQETVLININHIAAVESVTFGEKQLCKIYVSTPHQREGWVAETGCLIIQSTFSISDLRQLIKEAL